MGTTRFILRNDTSNKDGKFSLRGIYSVAGVRKYIKIKESLYQENWDPDLQRAVYLEKKRAKQLLPNIKYNMLPSAKEVDEINNTLIALRTQIKKIENRFDDDRIEYKASDVVKALEGNKTKTKDEAPTNQVFDFVDKYIQDNKASREPGSMCVYKSLKRHLSEFEVSKKKKITFDEIDYAFFLEFQNFLINNRTKRNPNGLGNVTIAKQLSTLKTFLNYARMQGIEVPDKYKDFKIKKESLEVLALTNDEFETLYHFDLSKNRKLDQVRDVFCFSCATGFRYSDLAQLKKEHIKDGEIRLTVTKTKQKLSVPLNPYSQSILDKYAAVHRPLPVISNQKMNEYIKELCKKAGINDPVQIVRFRGARREEKTYPKYEMIRVHTGRKTFATLSLEKGMSAEEVMKIGGWKSYASFARYVNITEKRTKVVMSKAWGSIQKLKAV